VLLVVLMGRDRIRGFKWFTASIVLMALRMLASRLLFGRMAQVVTGEIFLALADIAAIVSLMVVVEMARRAFAGAGRKPWLIGTLVLLLLCGAELYFWGPLPSVKTLFSFSQLGMLRLMQLVAQKFDLVADLLMVQLGLLIVLFGRRFHAPWRSHTQRVVIGLSTSSLSQLAVGIIWQEIALHTVIHSQAEYQRVMGLQEKLSNGNSVVYLAVLVWWIVCLWYDESGAKPAAVVEQPIASSSEQPAADSGQ
jgi:quinol-cytochrome oxidoreductase complex cytochrome b subunit